MILNTPFQAVAYRSYARSLLQIYLIIGPLSDLVKMSVSWSLELTKLVVIFTKSLRGPRIKYVCNKLSAYDLYALT